MIPKIIHYCWFGGKEIPQELQKCIDTWSKLEGYRIIRWDESNCSFDENDFVKKAYTEKKWAFVSDYYRLKALKEYGGIYLDTDVIVNSDFSPLLNKKCFMGYMVNCCVGTAVIGAEINSKIICDLVHLYDITKFVEDEFIWEYDETKDIILAGYFETNNWYFMKYLLKKYPSLSLNNRYQNFQDFTIYPKEFFEIGMLSGKHYTVHLNSGSWQQIKQKNGVKLLLKNIILNNGFWGEKIRIIIRKRRYKKMNKKSPFYKDSINRSSGNSIANRND